MRVTLTGAGYEVDDAKTAEDALEKIRQFRPDLVLFGINMPGMSGVTVARADCGAGWHPARRLVTAALQLFMTAQGPIDNRPAA